MKVCFKSTNGLHYNIDVDPKKATISSVIELLSKQEGYPVDKSANFIFVGKLITDDSTLNSVLSTARGNSNYFSEEDPIYLILSLKVK